MSPEDLIRHECAHVVVGTLATGGTPPAVVDLEAGRVGWPRSAFATPYHSALSALAGVVAEAERRGVDLEAAPQVLAWHHDWRAARVAVGDDPAELRRAWLATVALLEQYRTVWLGLADAILDAAAAAERGQVMEPRKLWPPTLH